MQTNTTKACYACCLLMLLSMPGWLLAQVPSSATRLDPSTRQRRPHLGRDGDTVHVVATNIDFTTDVYYARSGDGGRTWPVRERILATNTEVTGLAVSGDDVFVACNSNGDRSLLASFDRGDSWQTAVVLPPGYRRARVYAFGSNVLVFCVGASYSQNHRVLVVQSADRGRSWSAPRELSLGLPTGSTVTDDEPQVVVEGAAIHLFWNRGTPLLHLAYQSSMDGGATWLPTARWLTNAPLVGAGMGAGRLLVQASSTLWMSSNHGATWAPLPGHGLAHPSALAMDGANALVVEAVSTSGGAVLRMASSRDAGHTWTVSNTTFAAAAALINPLAEAHVIGDAMFVRHYTSGGSGLTNIQQSDDGGATWRSVFDLATVLFRADRDGGFALVEERQPAGLWIHSLEGHTRFGTGNAGTGGVVPTLTGRGLAGFGRTIRLELAQARGGALVGYVIGLTGITDLPMGSHARLHVAQPIGPSLQLASGAPGQAGVGTATLAVVIPNAPSLVGLCLVSQCFVVDPGAPDGFCATAARETWIR